MLLEERLELDLGQEAQPRALERHHLGPEQLKLNKLDLPTLICVKVFKEIVQVPHANPISRISSANSAAPTRPCRTCRMTTI